MTSSSCSTISYHPHGREGIGRAQPQSGTDYPLVQPSEDIRYLLADFYMSFDQLSDYSASPAFERPFRIKWLYGFGCVLPDFDIPTSADTSSSCGVSDTSSTGVFESVCLPVPQHDHDILIVDRNGRHVFDSTQSGITYSSRSWGDRLHVVSWQTDYDNVVTLTYHTMWNDNDYPEPREYPLYFFPENAVLQSRTTEQLPKRLRKLHAVLTQITKTSAAFVSGYNMAIDATPITPSGLRTTTRIVFNATPGAGAGVFPGCEPEPLVIRSINGARPTQDGDFFLDATGCYYVRQPTRVIEEYPRTTLPQILLPPGNVTHEDLPSPLAGRYKNLPGWPLGDSELYAHLKIGNDCGPCCSCEEYAETADQLNKEAAKYQKIGEVLEATRDLYHQNRDEWLAAQACLLATPLRVRLLPQLCPFLDVAIQYCNQTLECLTDVVLTVVLASTPVGTAKTVPGYTFITGASRQPGRLTPITELYTMLGAYPTFSANFDAVLPNQSVSARFRLRFPDCMVAYAVTATLTGTAGGVDIRAPGSEVAVSAEASAVLNCPTPPDSLVDLLECACEV